MNKVLALWIVSFFFYFILFGPFRSVFFPLLREWKSPAQCLSKCDIFLIIEIFNDEKCTVVQPVQSNINDELSGNSIVILESDEERVSKRDILANEPAKQYRCLFHLAKWDGIANTVTRWMSENYFSVCVCRDDLFHSLKKLLCSCAKWLDDIKFQQHLTKGEQQRYIKEMMMRFLYSSSQFVEVSHFQLDSMTMERLVSGSSQSLPSIIAFMHLLLLSFGSGGGWTDTVEVVLLLSVNIGSGLNAEERYSTIMPFPAILWQVNWSWFLL